MIKNTENNYGIIAKLFHWLIAIAIVSLITVGFIMSDMPASPDKYELYGMHKASGVLVLMLVVLRVLWKLSNKVVQPPADLPNILKLAAKSGHFLLYAFMLLMPISGICMSYFGGHDISVFGLFMIPAAIDKLPQIAGLFHQIHVLGIWAFITVITLHVGAAFYHHFIRRDNVLMRMIK
ncbi:MAG: cytochrome b [Rickettsiaceae bacterium]|nr:cytochrome b [Rickettsiaceae bacterium]